MLDLVDGSVGSDGVGDIVGIVSEGGGIGGYDLNEGVEVFSFVVVVFDVGVDGSEIIS